MKERITKAEMDEIFNIDLVTGLITWKKTTHLTRIGKEVGWAHQSKGLGSGYTFYRSVEIKNRAYPIHRLILFYSSGDWIDRIDHIDGNGLNNRLDNLRPCTRSENAANMKKPCTNTSGVKGVSWCGGKWKAQICLNQKVLCIGSFDLLEDAALAYAIKAKELFGEFANFGPEMLVDTTNLPIMPEHRTDKGPKSKYAKGVRYMKKQNKYRAVLYKDKKWKSLGVFDSLEEAAAAYNKARQS
jgi:hypothetical protein